MECRLGFALRRLGEQVGRVVVRFSDSNGPRGGSANRRPIGVGLRPRSVQVEETDADLFAAVDHATDCASRSVTCAGGDDA